MTFNSGIFRTLVASLVLLLAFAAVTNEALAREIRILPVPVATAAVPTCNDGAINSTGCDFVRAAAGLAPTFGPDAGVAPGPGDTLVVAPGTYFLTTGVGAACAAPAVCPAATPAAAALPPANGTGAIVVPGTVGYNGTAGFPAMENLKVRSRDGANVTVVTELAAIPLVVADIACVIIGADGVEWGGPGVDQGLTVRNCGNTAAAINVDGIQIGSAIGPINPLGITPAGQADEHINIQNNIVLNNGGDGVHVVSATNLDTFKVVKNLFRDNVAGGTVAGGPAVIGATAAQLYIAVGASVGTRGNDRNVVIEGNTFDGDTVVSAAGIIFGNAGTVEQVAILNNRVARHLGVGIGIIPPVTDFEQSVIAGNWIQQNGFIGLLFANIGRLEEVRITENRGNSIIEGITGNGLAGMLVAPLVTDIRDSEISYNNFNSNGAGVAILNTTDFETSTVSNNSVRQNTGMGWLILNTGDQDDIAYSNNEFRNNGLAGFASVATVGRIQNHMFDNNLFAENNILGIAMLVFSSQDLESTEFVNNNRVNKNGGGFPGPATPLTVIGSGMALIAGGGGDVGEIMFDNLNVEENTGNGALFFTTTGDVTNIDGSNSKVNNNGGMGLSLNALTPVAGAFLAGDIDSINLSNSSFSNNGTRTAVGFGSGLFFRGDNVDGFTLSDIVANSNNDHGAQWSANSDLNDVSVTGGEFSGNDRNVDSVGNGLDFSSNDTASDVSVSGVTTNNNNTGIRFQASGRTGRNLVVSESTVDNNRDTGVAFFGSEDLIGSGVEDSSLNGNQFGINFTVNEDGTGLFARGNSVVGDDGRGTGILLDANNVSVEENSIRKNNVGIEVRKMDGTGIHNNNIARNESAGIDALSLAPGEEVDATENWWGEPSGPKHATNPNGIGDRVTNRVAFQPWLLEPAVSTDVNFQITNFNLPATAAVNTPVSITATIKNNGTEEGSQSVQLKITGSDFVDSNTLTRTINPATSVDIDFSVLFPRGGTFKVTLSTQNDSEEAEITITGATGLTIEAVCDANDNNRIDDAEILTCVEFWITGQQVPGTGQTISDAKILFLIELWITNGDISTLPASAAKSAGWVESLVSLFAPAANVSHSAVKQVVAGESFTVTTTIKANNLQGLLLSEQLPAGWTVSEVTTAGGFFKPSETKWLWLSGDDVTVSYTVSVPASAAAGSYDIVGTLNTMDGFSTNNTLRVNVVKSDVLSVSGVAFNGSSFVAAGAGISGVDVQVYSLSGSLVFSGQSAGNTLSFNGLSSSGQTLANGVYLYVVTVNGANGQQVRTNVGKLIVLR